MRRTKIEKKFKPNQKKIISLRTRQVFQQISISVAMLGRTI